MVVRPVGLGTAVEVVALDHTGEALALRDAGHVDQVAVGEDVAECDLLADLVGAQVVDAELAERAELRQVLELAGLRLRQLAALERVGAELDGGVAVALGRAQPGHRIRFDGQDGDGHHRAVLLEHLGHADLSADESDAHRATPADASRRAQRKAPRERRLGPRVCVCRRSCRASERTACVPERAGWSGNAAMGRMVASFITS